MFAKLSALALCLSFVSALDVSLSTSVQAGATVELDLDIVAGDPVDIGLFLFGDSEGVEFGLAADVAVAATIWVDIPVNIPLGDDFVIAAVAVGDQTEVYANSNIFSIVT